MLKPGGGLVIADLGPWSAWALQRRAKAWLGSSTWKHATFRARRELTALVSSAGLVPDDYFMPKLDGVMLLTDVARTHGHVLRVLMTGSSDRVPERAACDEALPRSLG